MSGRKKTRRKKSRRAKPIQKKPIQKKPIQSNDSPLNDRYMSDKVYYNISPHKSPTIINFMKELSLNHIPLDTSEDLQMLPTKYRSNTYTNSNDISSSAGNTPYMLPINQPNIDLTTSTQANIDIIPPIKSSLFCCIDMN
jgi:hypothetical protein